MRFSTVGVMGLLLVGGIALAQPPLPLGGQFQVNTYTGFQQYFAEVAADPQGNFVIVWQSLVGSGTHGNGWRVEAQRYDAHGIPVGGEFQVNSYSEKNQQRPAVAADDQGNFVVAWQGTYQDDPLSGNVGIVAQRYDASGNPVGMEFQVNSYTTNIQWHAAVAIDSQGEFVVVWDSLGSPGNDNNWYSVQAKRYDAGGTPVWGEYQVNSFTTNHQTLPKVAVDEDGDFVVVWQSAGSYGTDDSQWSIQVQRYASDGSMDGGQFQVNTYTTSHQFRPALAMDGQGNFVVVWNSFAADGTDTDRWSIQGQRFDSSGTSVGGQFQVNSYTTGDQYNPVIALDNQGNFVVVWDSIGSYGTDTSDASIQGQLYDASGTPIGGQFQVNTYTTDEQELPVVSSLDVDGNFVVVWRSMGSFGDDVSSHSTQARRYASRGVFGDDFELGNVSTWSFAIP